MNGKISTKQISLIVAQLSMAIIIIRIRKNQFDLKKPQSLPLNEQFIIHYCLSNWKCEISVDFLSIANAMYTKAYTSNNNNSNLWLYRCVNEQTKHETQFSDTEEYTGFGRNTNEKR